jgi:hypothetical protein
MDQNLFLLRTKPIFKIEFKEHGIIIADETTGKKNSLFMFEKLDFFQFQKKRTNWGITILSFIVDIFTGQGLGKKYYEKNTIELVHDGVKSKYYLNNCELRMVPKIVSLIHKKIY